MNSPNHIAVIGMACRFPNATTPWEYWQNLRAGVDNRVHYTDEELRAAGVSESLLKNPDYVKTGFPLPGYAEFDTSFFGLSRREGALMDPQHRQFLECSWEALEIAGYASSFDGDVGVFGGSGHNAYLSNNLMTNRSVMETADLFYLRHLSNDKDFLTTRVSYSLDLSGPSINIQTACSTSLVAIHTACQSLINGECDIALAGGVTIELPHHQGYLYRPGEVLSPTGLCRAFDASSNGTLFGSGVGVVVLKLLEDAIEDGDHIQAIVLGSAVNNDGSSKAGYMAPSVDGQAKAIREALDISGCDASTIEYIESHGTGTAIGDPIEIEALNQVYSHLTERRSYCTVSSVKPNIGHLDTAAGVASFIKAVLAIRHSTLPGLLNYTSPNPECQFEGSPFRVHSEFESWACTGPRRAGVSSLGVGGTNAHLVLEQAPPRKSTRQVSVQVAVELSARSSTDLDRYSARLADHLEKNGDCDLQDLAWTLKNRRSNFPHRRSIYADSAQNLIEKLRQPSSKIGPAGKDPLLAFCFAGGGAQQVGMARELADWNSSFREHLDSALSFVEEATRLELNALLLGKSQGGNSQLDSEFQRPSLSVPSIFIVQYALAQSLIDELGVVPDSCIGHSLGDYAAATIAGTFSLKDAVELVVLRGKLIESISGAAMTSVMVSHADATVLLESGAEVASINAPNLCVLSGSLEQIETVENMCIDRDWSARRVPLKAAAHCSLLDPILPAYRERLEQATLNAPTLPLVCNSSGDWLTGEQATSVDYWVSHLRNTVNFLAGVSFLKQQTEYTFLEIGPGATLTNFINQCTDSRHSAVCVTTLSYSAQQHGTEEDFLQTLGDLRASGYAVPDEHLEGQAVAVPTFVLNQEPCWIEPSLGTNFINDLDSSNAALRKSIENWRYVRRWTCEQIVHREPSQIGRIVCIGTSRLFGHIQSLLSDAIESCVYDSVESLRSDSRWIAPIQENRELHILYLCSGNYQDVFDEHAMGGLLELFREIANYDQRIYLTILSRNGFALDAVPPSNPIPAAAAAASRVATSEVEHLYAQSVDLEAEEYDWRIPVEAAAVINACSSREKDEHPWRTLAWRNGSFLSPSHLEVPSDLQSAGYDQGTYLITGGNGWIARGLARQLVTDFDCRILLLVRNDTGEHLRHPNIDVLEYSTEEPGQLTSYARLAEETSYPLRGAFHTAGVVDDELIQLLDVESARRVFAAKHILLESIDQALEEFKLDFFLLFSSMSTEQGIQGQVAYATANAFLDSYAAIRRSQGCPMVSVAWTAWENASNKSDGRVPIRNRHFSAKKIAGGKQSFYLQASTQMWMLGEHRTISNLAIMPGTGFLSLAHAAYREVVAEDPFSLCDVSFVELFSVPDDLKRHLAVHVNLLSSDEHEVVFTSRDEEVEYARMRASKDIPPTPQRIDYKLLLAKMTISSTPLLVDEYMHFGERWQNAKQVSFGDKTAVIELELPATYEMDIADFPMHAALLDVGIAGAQTIAGFDRNKDFLVPFSYGRIDIYEGLSRRVVSVVMQKERSSEFVYFDVQIQDRESGKVLIQVQDFCMRRLDPRVIVDASADDTDKDIEDGISLEAGILQILSIPRDLSQDRVVISPTNPDLLITESMSLSRPPTNSGGGELAARPNLSSEYVEVSSKLGQEILNTWSQALGIGKIGLDDDFFELGGHSLLLTRISTKVQKILRKRVPLEALFKEPTIRGWESALESGQVPLKAGSSIKRISRDRYLLQ